MERTCYCKEAGFKIVPLTDEDWRIIEGAFPRYGSEQRKLIRTIRLNPRYVILSAYRRSTLRDAINAKFKAGQIK